MLRDRAQPARIPLERLRPALGPFLLLAIWLLLPFPVPETWDPRHPDRRSDVFAELVGYAVGAPEDGRPLLVGRGEDADVHLHQAPVDRRAAFLLAPDAEDAHWRVRPAAPGVTPRLLDGSSIPRRPDALADGDLLVLGRTRFFVRVLDGRLELVHVRHPGAPGFFAAGSANAFYHPNRRSIWGVPACGEALRLAVDGEDDGKQRPSRIELAAYDAERHRQMSAAAVHEGRPLHLPAVERRTAGEGLTACVDGENLLLQSPQDHAQRLLSVATLDEVVELGGNLLRFAPSRSRQLTRWTRLGLAFFLGVVLVTQSLLLRRRSGEENLSFARLQEWTGIAVCGLLFIGASYQLLLALHPRMAGKPDYAQAFLLGTVLVGVLTAASAGWTAFGLAGALGAAAVALTAAGAWWLGDAFFLGKTPFESVRDAAVASAGAAPAVFGRRLLQGMVGLAVVAPAFAFLQERLPALPSRSLENIVQRMPPLAFSVLLASTGLAVGVLQRSALAFEVAVLAAVAWYGAYYWSFVRRGAVVGGTLRRRTAAYSLGSGVLMLAFINVFLLVGTRLPDVLSFFFLVAGTAAIGFALRLLRGSVVVLRLLAVWAFAALFGAAFATLVLRDMGSVAAWAPALAAGLALWIVRPEEGSERPEEKRRARAHLVLTFGVGLVLLGTLDAIRFAVDHLDWQVLERPRQRLVLAEDVSYITPGEWITEVRWLASHRDAAFAWVPNVNSDVAIFGVAANLGIVLAVLSSLLLLVVAGCAALAADLALRRARRRETRSPGRLAPAFDRALGLFLGMASVLLVCQWLVHLSTGVVLHLPITGLVFPWISHGNTTHLIFAAAVLLPLAALSRGLGEGCQERW